MPPVQIALWTVLGFALLTSVVTDVTSGRILDVVTWPTMVVALVLRATVVGWGAWDELGALSGALGASGLMALFAVLAWRGKMGWGDVKLMGAVGATLGLPLALTALVFTSVAGAVQAVVTLLWQRQFGETVSAWARAWAVRLRLVPDGVRHPTPKHIPYGVAIAVGSACAMWWES